MRLFAAFLVVAAMNMTLAIVPAQARGFSFEDFFTGRTVAEGSFRAITGLQRRFTVALHGKWDGRTLTLREDFTFDDGTRDHKTWRFVKVLPITDPDTGELIANHYGPGITREHQALLETSGFLFAAIPASP